MPDKKINIVYIDDNSDEILSQYMTKEYCATPFQQPDITQIEKVYKEIRFCGNEGYEALLQNVTVKAANVILIDNHLFEERTIGTGRFSGKQFKIILRKILPYVEVIIITQDETRKCNPQVFWPAWRGCHSILSGKFSSVFRQGY